MRELLTDWSNTLDRLSRAAALCPNCGVLHNLTPVTVSGRAEDLASKNPNRVNYFDAGYLVFAPPDQRDDKTGFAVVDCDNCQIRFIVAIPHYDYQGPISVVWPIPGISVSDDVPEPVHSAVVDAKLAHAVGSITGAVMSIRTAVERIQTHAGAGSLSELWETKGLSPSLFDTANEPRLWANVITHKHKDFDPADVTLEHVTDLLGFLDILLDMVYIIPEKLKRSRESRAKLTRPDSEQASTEDDNPGNSEDQMVRRPPFV